MSDISVDDQIVGGEADDSSSVAPAVSASAPVSASTPKTSINVHPKVFAGFLAGLGVTIATGVAAYVTPDSLSFLGVWAVPVAGAAGTGVTLLVSWLKGVKTSDA